MLYDIVFICGLIVSIFLNTNCNPWATAKAKREVLSVQSGLTRIYSSLA